MISTSTIRCLQLNLKKSKIATCDMFSYSWNTHIFLLQEPWVYKDCPRGIPRNLKQFFKPPDSRAIIVVDASLDVSPCTE
jgi:hypothetical protein